MLQRWAAATLLIATAAGCSEDLPSGSVRITLGHESDTWTRAPAPTSVAIEKVLSSDQSRVTLDNVAAPVDHFSLGTGGPGWFEVTGKDTDGVATVRGRSIEIDPAGFAGAVLPLFVGRADAFSRPPGELATVRGNALPVAAVSGRHLLVAGAATADGFEIDGYDFATWTPHPAYDPVTCPSAPCTVRSLAVVDVTLAVFVGDDWALYLDMASGTSGSIPPPAGLTSFGEIAGGRTIVAPDGSAYVVGATRGDSPTSAVLRLSSSGEPSLLRLVAPRARAAATWVAGHGLVVVGGSADAAGAELIADGAAASTALPFPSDATLGAAIVSTDGSTVIRMGGRDAQGAPATSVALALGCATGCTPTPAGPDVPIDDAQAFAFDAGVVLAIGTGSDGVTAFRLQGTDAVALPCAEARSGASALLLPTGQIGVVGGTLTDGTPATTIELWLP